MSSSTVMVYEFFTGGGFRGNRIHSDLSAEALGMLWAVLADFRLWGEVHTITAFDRRFENRIPGLNLTSLPADEIVAVSSGDDRDVFDSLLRRCDAALIIAPETDGILAGLTERAESAGIPVLGSCSSAIAVAGNKEWCRRALEKAGLPVPATRCVTFDSALDAANAMKYPLVIKPLDGAGSEGVCLVESQLDACLALNSVRAITGHDKVLLQSFIAGQHASVSILAGPGRCLPMSLNLQLIDTGSSFRYLGSQVPFQHQAASTACKLACSAVQSIPGLKGYVGVDLVLTGNSAHLIEINPRLTTSYIGLRQVTRINLTQAIWKACVRGLIPDQIPISGRVIVEIDDFMTWGLSDWPDQGTVPQC